MRYFTVFLFLILSTTLLAQEKHLLKGVVINELTLENEPNISIINLNTLKVTKTNNEGVFQIEGALNDTLHFSAEGFRALKLRVTNDWIKDNAIKVYIKDGSTVLDEMIINSVQLTGYLQVDTKLLALADYPYTRSFDVAGVSPYYNNGFNPINGIYNLVKRKSKTNMQIRQIKEETALIEIMKSKYDRETVSALLNISKEEIVQILQRCNQSERFIYTASDYQIFNAVNECFQINTIKN